MDELEAALDDFHGAPSLRVFERAGAVADAISGSIRAAGRANPDVAARHGIVERYVDAAQMVTTAAHEAGHAVVGWFTGDRPRRVTIAPEEEHRGMLLGFVEFSATKNIGHGFVDRAATSLAGSVAERYLWCRIAGASGARLFGLPYLGGRSFPTGDLAHAETYCARLDRAVALAEEILSAHWQDLLRVTDALLAEKTLDAGRIHALLSATSAREHDRDPSRPSSVLDAQTPRG